MERILITLGIFVVTTLLYLLWCDIGHKDCDSYKEKDMKELSDSWQEEEK